MRREMVCAIPPFFGDRISYPALIVGESHDLGHDSGLEAMAKRWKIPEGFLGEIRGML